MVVFGGGGGGGDDLRSRCHGVGGDGLRFWCQCGARDGLGCRCQVEDAKIQRVCGRVEKFPVRGEFSPATPTPTQFTVRSYSVSLSACFSACGLMGYG